MSNTSKETMTKKQQDELNSSFNSKMQFSLPVNVILIWNVFLDLPWGLPLGFPSLSPFGAFPAFGLPTPNFPSLNSFASSTSTAFPASLLSNDSTTNPSTASTDAWTNGLSAASTNPMDYNEYIKQLGFLRNAFSEQQKPPETDKSKGTSVYLLICYVSSYFSASPSIKHSKTKSSHTPSTSSSPDVHSTKKHDDSRRSS